MLKINYKKINTLQLLDVYNNICEDKDYEALDVHNEFNKIINEIMAQQVDNGDAYNIIKIIKLYNNIVKKLTLKNTYEDVMVLFNLKSQAIVDKINGTNYYNELNLAPECGNSKAFAKKLIKVRDELNYINW